MMQTNQIVVIGGGVGGCMTALKLADAGFKVLLLEKYSQILSSTSNRTPGRMGLGFHYLSDINTAKIVLMSTIKFFRRYREYVLGYGIKNNYHLCHGRYFVVKNSLFSVPFILENCEKLKEIYSQLIQENSKNAVFGDPQDFYKVLDKSCYQHIVDSDSVELGIETQECLLDWPKFKNFLTNIMTNHPNIIIKTNHYISEAKLIKERNAYKITTIHAGNNQSVVVSPLVVNCSWEGIANINKSIGFKEDLEYTDRVKLLTEVFLPESLKTQNSMFFCVGPYCMFTNMGNGLGRITYAPVTNCRTENGYSITEKFQSWLDNGLTEDEVNYFGKKIIEGVARLIPEMQFARLKMVFAGVVKSMGDVDIYSSYSDFHKRDSVGIKVKAPGWIENACIKFFFCEDNSEEVLAIVNSWTTASKQSLKYSKVK